MPRQKALAATVKYIGFRAVLQYNVGGYPTCEFKGKKVEGETRPKAVFSNRGEVENAQCDCGRGDGDGEQSLISKRR